MSRKHDRRFLTPFFFVLFPQNKPRERRLKCDIHKTRIEKKKSKYSLKINAACDC